MSTRARWRWLTLPAIVSAFALVSGCSSAPATPNTSGLQATCARIAPYLQALADPASTGGLGTYGDVPGISDNISFYSSAWKTLAIAADSGIGTERARPALQKLFNKAATSPQTVSKTTGLSDLTSLSLALRASRALGSSTPLRDSEFSRWHQGDRFVEGRGSSAVDMTPVVALVYDQYRQQLPTDVTATAVHAVTSSGTGSTVEEILRDKIPTLYVASMAPHLSASEKTSLTRAFQLWAPHYGDAGLNGFTVATAVYVRAAAQRLDLPDAEDPTRALRAPATITRVTDLARTDAQVLYNATVLHLIPETTTTQLAASRLSPLGWLESVSSPNLATSFYGAVTAASCGWKYSVSAAQLRQWRDTMQTGDLKGALQLCVLQTLGMSNHMVKTIDSCESEWKRWMRARAKSDNDVVSALYQGSKKASLTKFRRSGNVYASVAESREADLPATALVMATKHAAVRTRLNALRTFRYQNLWSLQKSQHATTELALMFAAVLASGRADTARAAATVF
jgi:hypothetical protein